MAYRFTLQQLSGGKINVIKSDEDISGFNEMSASECDLKRILNQNKINAELCMELFDKTVEMNYVTSHLPFANDIKAQHAYHKANNKFALNIISFAVKISTV